MMGGGGGGAELPAGVVSVLLLHEPGGPEPLSQAQVGVELASVVDRVGERRHHVQELGLAQAPPAAGQEVLHQLQQQERP